MERTAYVVRILLRVDSLRAIHPAPVPHTDDQHDQLIVDYLIDYSVTPNPQPSETRKFALQDTACVRLLSKTVDCLDEPNSIFLGGFSESFRCARFNLQRAGRA